MKSLALDDILNNPAIWRIGQVPMSRKATIPTGSSLLDIALPGHGWEIGALTEILTNEQGIGELSLLIPALRETTRSGRAVVLVAPPYVPLPMTLENRSALLHRIVIINAEKQELLWATEQAARSGAAGMVVAWESGSPRDWNYQALRRLHVAADNGGTALLLYRRASAINGASPAPTRLSLSADSGELLVQIAKRRGALIAETIRLNLFPPHWRARSACVVRETREASLENSVAAVFSNQQIQHLSASR